MCFKDEGSRTLTNIYLPEAFVIPSFICKNKDDIQNKTPAASAPYPYL